jgi:hypothetical protein
MVGRGVPAGVRVGVPVQTIDLLPTVLSALGIPRPARMRGRDLGPLLASAGSPAVAEHGLAFAETDDFELYAEDADRLVCDKRAGACALFDVSANHSESRDMQSAHPERARQLRARLVGLAHAHGQFEGQGGTELPEALRLGLQGDVGAAPEVAALLDDANVAIRRKAAAVLFALRGKGAVAELARALATDEDEEVQRFAALALVRAGEPPSARAEALLHADDFDVRKLAALAFADRRDRRAGADLATWFSAIAQGRESPDFTTSKEVVIAIGRLGLVSALGDLQRVLAAEGSTFTRLRPFVADALGEIGDPRARPALLSALNEESQSGARIHEARAAARLAAGPDLLVALSPLAYGSDPMLGAVTILREAGMLTPARGGWPTAGEAGTVHLPPGAGAVSVLVEQETPQPLVFAGARVEPRASAGGVSRFELDVAGSSLPFSAQLPIRALWAVRVLRPDAGAPR